MLANIVSDRISRLTEGVLYDTSSCARRKDLYIDAIVEETTNHFAAGRVTLWTGEGLATTIALSGMIAQSSLRKPLKQSPTAHHSKLLTCLVPYLMRVSLRRDGKKKGHWNSSATLCAEQPD